MTSQKVLDPEITQFRVYYPFGRRTVTNKHQNECSPPSYKGSPSGWPHLEISSSVMRGELPTNHDVLTEEQYDKYTPVETSFDREHLIDQYVLLMNNLEKTDKGLCCDKIFQEEARFLKKSMVPRRPNCPKLWPPREQKLINLDSIKLKDTRRPPTPPVFFRKPRNPFDLHVDELYPEHDKFVIPTNRNVKIFSKAPSFSELYEGTPQCVPVDSYKSHPCYGK